MDAAPTPRPRRLRTTLSLVLLPLVLAAIALHLGLLDPLVKYRMRTLAQMKTEEWRNRWLGVETLQYPNDLVLYQQLVHEVKPDLIIETGTHKGGLALYLSTLLEAVNPQAKILTVDIDGAPWRETAAALSVEGRERLLARITFFKGSSTAPEIVEAIRAQIPSGARVLVILDALHTKAHVLEECRLYGRLVSPGSYLVVNDTHLGGWFSGLAELDDPLAAVQEFLAEAPEFQAEPLSERFVLSCAHRGFLKRVK